jgi:hypothetical protein
LDSSAIDYLIDLPDQLSDVGATWSGVVILVWVLGGGAPKNFVVVSEAEMGVEGLERKIWRGKIFSWLILFFLNFYGFAQ